MTTLTVEKKQKKETPVADKFKDNIEKMFGKESGIYVVDPTNIHIEKFPTGSLKLDIALKGGYPKGTIIEPYGWEQSGKTTSAIEAAKQHQKKYTDERVLWVDMERVFDHEYFTAIGVDITPEKFTLVKPDTGEQAYTIMLEFVKNCKGGLIIVDSVPTLLPESTDEADMGDAQISVLARLNSQGIRKLIPHMHRNKTTIFMINQLRANIGGMGSNNITTGGNTIRFYARTRIQLGSGNSTVEDATKIYVKLDKANYGNPKYKFETDILYGKGFDFLGELVDLAEESKVIQKSGSWYKQGELQLGQGKEQVKQFLLDNEEFKNEVEGKVRSHFNI